MSYGGVGRVGGGRAGEGGYTKKKEERTGEWDLMGRVVSTVDSKDDVTPGAWWERMTERELKLGASDE